MLGIRKNSTTRTIIYMFSAFCVGGSAIGAFGSIMRLGQQTQAQAAIDSAREQAKNNRIADVQAEADKAQALAKANLGSKTDQFIIRGLNQKNFFDAATQHAEAIREFKSAEREMNLLDSNRNVLGTFDGEQVCDLKQICKRIN